MLDCVHLHLIYYSVSFCMFRTNFLSINLLKPPQSVILLEVSSDSRLSWSIRSIENATNTHEYLIVIWVLEQPALKSLLHGLSQSNFEMIIFYVLQAEIHRVLLYDSVMLWCTPTLTVTGSYTGYVQVWYDE